MMQELRQTGQQVQSLEIEHTQKKRVYDAAMAGYDSENTQDAEVTRLTQELQELQRQIEDLDSQIEKAKSDHDRGVSFPVSWIESAYIFTSKGLF